MGMAASAKLLEPVEEAIAHMPSASILPYRVPNVDNAAEQLVAQQAKVSEEWLDTMRTSTRSAIERVRNLEVLTMLRESMSQAVERAEWHIAQTDKDMAEALSQSPPPLPRTAIRTIGRGLKRVRQRQREVLVDLYYEVVVACAEADPESRERVGTATNAAELSAMLKRIRPDI